MMRKSQPTCPLLLYCNGQIEADQDQQSRRRTKIILASRYTLIGALGIEQDQRIEQEVTRAAEKPEDLSRVLEHRKLDAVFRLWAERRGEGGRVERKDLSRALNRHAIS